ncbi:MAG: [FeFe] hydrogenase H-cluster radical SAM maturase HydE [Synergistaceae bacterium]|jgi:biotin synthase|nr:[FeFe] hydrogenase H-cluster radical SAM maturase HydE [Synergistaceae bacterium]
MIEKLKRDGDLSDDELKILLASGERDAPLFAAADEVRRAVYGTDVYIRGLIEFTNHCKNDCLYCGIRRGNGLAERYRLTPDEILECAGQGYELGFRTFVLQGGEDQHYTDEMICEIISRIKKRHGDCAVTLSIGEKPKESYRAYWRAGADRYLLRHETADGAHYSKLHPASMSLDVRKRCLWDLKEIGFQVGSGFMVGSPHQTTENIVSDLRFLQELEPAMIGIGPFISHKDTPFRNFASGTAELTLRLVAILRLMFPYALIPATTALGTIAPDGRERGLAAGANVVMPNLSPVGVRKHYLLYDNKICTGDEAAECRKCLEAKVALAGYEIVVHRGDAKTHFSGGVAV